jgi:hypothetical protein
MDWMTFVVGVLKAIAWPSTLLGLTFWLRKPIRDLVPLLRKLKVKEFELEFVEKVEQLDINAHPKPREPTVQFSLDAPGEANGQGEAATNANTPVKKLTREEEVLRLAPLSSRAAIMEAWGEVEAASAEAAASRWGPGNHPETFRTMARLGEYLLQSKVIDDGQLVAFNTLRDLRNKAAHAEELNIGVNETRKYVELAFALAKHIRSA